MTPPAVKTWLQDAETALRQTLGLPTDSARIEAGVLLGAALAGASRAWLMTHGEQVLTVKQHAAVAPLLARRLRGEPIAYVLGQREFYGLIFDVTPQALIPRPDTETLVEAALQHIPQQRACRVLDLGTGSGAVAVAIAHHRPLAQVVAVDRSEGALDVARANACKLGAPGVRFVQSDWFSALQGEHFDVIAGNPPYIAAGDPHLGQGDLRFEPQAALVSGADGLAAIRTIVAAAPAHLVQNGALLLEHGYDQADCVAVLYAAAGLGAIHPVHDLAGIARVTVGMR